MNIFVICMGGGPGSVSVLVCVGHGRCQSVETTEDSLSLSLSLWTQPLNQTVCISCSLFLLCHIRWNSVIYQSRSAGPLQVFPITTESDGFANSPRAKLELPRSDRRTGWPWQSAARRAVAGTVAGGSKMVQSLEDFFKGSPRNRSSCSRGRQVEISQRGGGEVEEKERHIGPSLRQQFPGFGSWRERGLDFRLRERFIWVVVPAV